MSPTDLRTLRGFIPVSIGTQSVKIRQEVRKLQPKIKWHVFYIFMAHGVYPALAVSRCSSRINASTSYPITLLRRVQRPTENHQQ